MSFSLKNNYKELICENSLCAKKFRRKLSAISFRNFCSQKCYGTLVTFRNRSTKKCFKYCLYCGTRIGIDKTYCSPQCWGKNHRISKEEVVKRLKKLYRQLGRTPTRRECRFYTTCIRVFGSYSKSLIAANLTPYRSLNQRMYRRRRCIAKDGHICNSVSELIIDNWLYSRKISHQKETPYPRGNFKADWSLKKDVFIEYFGLAKDSRRYDNEIKKKQKICQTSNVNLIEIYSQDLFPKNRLEEIIPDYSPNQRLISFSASSGEPEA